MNTYNDVKHGACETKDRIVLVAFQNTQNGFFVFIVIKKKGKMIVSDRDLTST